jgi:hypothetical protein
MKYRLPPVPTTRYRLASAEPRQRVARRSAEQGQQENEQDERLATLEEQASASPDPPAQDAPAAAPSMPDQLKQLAALHEQGALTDDEFATAKARLLGT